MKVPIKDLTVWYKLNSNKSRWKIFCVVEREDQLHQVMSDLFNKYIGVVDVRVTPCFWEKKPGEES